jgi:DNA polymerase III subunit gamma/tau
VVNLAIKYRPTKFSEILGQSIAVRILKNSLVEGMMKPAYLLSGPYGSGKTTLGYIFSKSILCTGMKDLEYCGECHSCVSFDTFENPDFIEIDAGSSGLVKTIREVLNSLDGTKKIILIDESHQLSKEAQSLCLAEIKKHSGCAFFVFCSTNQEKMDCGLKSHCVRLNLSVLSPAEIISNLSSICEGEGISYEVEALKVLAKVSNGHMRDAIMYLDQVSLVGDVEYKFVAEYFNYDLEDVYADILYHLGDKSSFLPLVDGLLCRVSVQEIYDGLARVSLDSYLSADDSNKLKSMYGVRLLAISKEIIKSNSYRPSKTELLCDLLLLDVLINDNNSYRDLQESNNFFPENKKVITQKDLIKKKSRNGVKNYLSGEEIAEIIKCEWIAKIKDG